MWVDINAHLELMSSPPEHVLEEARAVGVNFIATGAHPDQWHWIESRSPYLAFGLHPHHVDQQCQWLTIL
jgi:TatD DNase family protein